MDGLKKDCSEAHPAYHARARGIASITGEVDIFSPDPEFGESAELNDTGLVEM